MKKQEKMIKNTHYKKRKMAPFRLSLLSMAIGAITSSIAMAGPNGGEVTGGSGSISHSGNTTTIQQNTDRMAIDWQSYNVGSDERVQYIQPDSSSVSLNRILSNSASNIQGRIDANGQVILVNPHGILFGKDSVVNAGGILASGLSIDTDQFMNGDFTFREIEGTDGAVLASGIINAASGGSVALIGKSVENEGLISAELGSVQFAAGREAVVTFGESGFIGVRVSDALVEEQMGVDAAVLNSGEINVEGGQVLLTASASRDVFSGVINTGDLEFDRSVVVNSDGSYTLGGGADIANTGSINVSGERGGDVVLLGENITHSGVIKADSLAAEHAGSIELHSADTTLLIEASELSANAAEGVGGDIKVLGNRVGLFDTAAIQADGQAGGQILIGGDERGENTFVPNAQAVFAGENTLVSASANSNAYTDIAEIKNDGGTIILWGDDSLIARGELSAKGLNEGDGGFIETSSAFVQLDPKVDVSGGESGENGLWLIDPYDITIGSDDSPQVPNAGPSGGIDSIFSPNADTSFLSINTLRNALNGSSSVLVETFGDDLGTQDGDITVDDEISFDSAGNASLTLRADNNIIVNANIFDNAPGSVVNDSLNLTLTANANSNAVADGGNINIATGVDINLQGGNFTASGNNFENLGTISTRGGDFLFENNAFSALDNTFNNQGSLNVQSDNGGGNIGININGDVLELGAIELGDSAGENTNNAANPTTFIITANNITTTELIRDGGNNTSNNHVTDIVFNAQGNIIFDGSGLDNRGGDNVTHLTLNADTNKDLAGDVIIRNQTSLWLNGGDFLATGHNFTLAGTASGVNRVGTEGGTFSVGRSATDRISGSFNSSAAGAELHTYRNDDRTGDVSVYAQEDIDLGSTVSTAGGADTWNYDPESDDGTSASVAIVLDAVGNTTIHEALALDRFTGRAANTVDISAGNTLTIDADLVHTTDTSEFTFGAGTGGFINNAPINTNGSNIGINSVNDSNAVGVNFNDNITAFNLFVETSGGDITDTGTGTAVIDVNNITLTAGTGDVTLNNAGLSIGNRIAAPSANNLTVVENDDIRILNTTLSGNLTLTATGDNGIFDDSQMFVGGTTTFVAADNLIQFNNPNSNFVGAVSATGAQIEITDTNDFVIGGLNLTGAASTNTINATGAITHASGNNINTNGGVLEITGGSAQVNDVTTDGGRLNITGSTVQLGDINTASGAINITANATSDSVIALAGNINSGNGLITLNAQNNGNVELINTVNINAGTSNFTLGSDIISDADAAAESLTINAQQITLENILTAATQAGASGGDVTLSGSGISTGEINTSGRDGVDVDVNNGGSGGTVSLTATNTGAAEIVVAGDINTQGGAGALSGANGSANIELSDGATSGLVNLSDAPILSSNVTITGSDSGSDELIGPSDDTSAVIWQSTASGGTFGNSVVSEGVVTFSGFETITGGSGADQFTLNHDTITEWNGGEGADEFNIAAGLVLNVYGNRLGDNDDDSVNTVSLSNTTGVHNWTITAAGTGNLTSGFSFFLFDNLNGSDGGDDRFQLNEDFGDTNTIDARGQTNADSFLVSAIGTRTIGFDESFGGILNIEAIQAQGDADDFVLQLTGDSSNNQWTIDGENSGSILNNDTAETISFINFSTLLGNAGDDTFTFESSGRIARIGGGGGTNNTANFSALTTNLNLTLDETLGDIDDTTTRVTDIQTVLAPASTSNTLSFNSDTANAYTWTFFDFDGDTGLLADGLRDGQIQQTNGSGAAIGSAINFGNFDILSGGDAQDTFIVGATGINASIDGGNGNDTLQSYSSAVRNEWTINGSNEGVLEEFDALDVAGTIGFSSIENLIGADTAPDVFSFEPTGAITGSISAGDSDGVIDAVDFSGSDTAQELTIGDGVNGVLGIERFIGNSSLVNTLTGNGDYFIWNINGENEGEIFNADRTERIVFENFSQLRGTAADDIFTLNAAGTIDEILGGSGTNELVSVGASRAWFMDDAATPSAGRRVEQAGVSVVDSFNGIQILQGADNFSDSFTLAANSNFTGELFGGAVSADPVLASTQNNTFTVLSDADSDVQWNLLDTDFSVSRSDSAVTTSFSQIENVVGGAGNDTFNVDDAFLDTGVRLDGRATIDRDVLNVAALADNNTALLLDVTAANNAVTLSRDATEVLSASNIEALVGSAQSNLTFQSLFANTWTIDALDSGELNATVGGAARLIAFENISNLTGGSGTDNFTIESGASLTGLLVGAGGSNSLANNNAGLTWALSDAFAGEVGDTDFTGIQTLNANNGILIGRAQNNVWTVDEQNGGTLALDDATAADEITFSGMSSLYGNSGSDNFIIVNAGSITGDIQGTLNETVDTTDDRLEVTSTDGDAIAWVIDTNSSVTRVNDFSLIENLVGGAGDDNFTINNIPFALNINGAANTEVTDELPLGDRITWNVDDVGAGVRLSDSEQRIRRNDGSTTDLIFDDIEIVFGSNSSTATDRFTILGGTVAQALGRNGADTFTIDNSEKDDINIRLFGGGMTGVFDNLLIGANRDNTWIFDSEDDTFSTLNAIDADNQGILFNNAFQTFRGGDLDDTFIYVSGNAIPTIDGSVGNLGSINTLEVQSAASDADQVTWTITGDNSGAVQNRVTNFSNIQNLTGGTGTDVFNIAGGNVDGLIDAVDNDILDDVEDTFNIGGLTEAVVVIGVDGSARPFVDGGEDSPYFNITAFETVLADDLNPEEAENNRWIVVNSDRDIDWIFSNFNSGNVFQRAGPLDTGFVEGEQLVNTAFFFDNFGSAQGGAGVDTRDNPDGLTGIFNDSGGGQNLIYGQNVNLAVVFITPDILEVTGTDGNVVLRIAPDDVIEDANFNGANEWTISGENSGNFLASYFDNGEDDSGFSFDFSGVNRIEGGEGNDLFNFTNTGALVDGYINGGGGDNTITLASNHSLGLDFGVSTLNTVATDLSGDGIFVFPANNLVALPELFEVDNRTGVIDVLNIDSITAETSLTRTDPLRIRSAETGNFGWDFNDQLLNTDTGIALSYTGFDEVQGGGANDVFVLPEDLVLPFQLDGGDGNDTVNLNAFSSVVIDLDNVEGNYLNVENYVGNNISSELFAADGLNIWTIDGVNQGAVLNNGQTISFSGFNTLQGGSNTDEITITRGGITGDIFGNNGDDELNVSLGFTDETLTSGATETVTFIGGNGNNTANFTGGSDTNRFAGDYTPSILISSDNTRQQTFNYRFDQPSAGQNTPIILTNVSDIVEEVFTSVMTISGIVGQADTIRVSNGLIQVDGFSEIAASNNAGIIVDGEATDEALIVGDINVTDEFVVNNASVVLDNDSFTVGAGSAIRFNNNTQIGDADNRINIDTPNLSLNSIVGETYILSNSNINLAELNNSNGIVDILAQGNITDGTALNSLQNIVLMSDGDIVLDNENILSGLITLNAQNITLNNASTNLGNINTQDFTLTTRGNVADEGVLNISGVTTINGQENSVITLDNVNNAFNQVAVNNAGSVTLVDGSADGLSVSGGVADSFSVAADGNINTNAIDADTIELNSTNGNILTLDTINADTVLTLSGSNITVNGIINVGDGVNTNSVTTLTAGNMVQLNAAILGNVDTNEMNITADTVLQSVGANLSAQNLTVETSGAQIFSGNTSVGNNFSSISGSTFTMNSNTEFAANNIDISAQDNITTQSLTAETIVLDSANGSVSQQSNITTDTIFINALAGGFNSNNGATLTLNEGASTLDAIDASLNGDIVGDSSLTINLANQFSQSGNIILDSVEINANDIEMDSNSETTGTSGVMLNSQQDIDLASVSSAGEVSLVVGGAVVDNNGAVTNVTADSLFARSENGFGEPGLTGDTLETSVDNIDIQNNLNGIGLVNNGDVSVTSLISNSDVLFRNDNGNVILANSDTGSYDLNASDAREAGGVINANYDFGRLTLVVSDGFLDATPAPFVERPELVGDIVEVSTTEGFGVTRRIVVFARTEAIVSGRGIQPFFGFNTPPELGLTTDTDLLSLTDVSSAAELLVEVENLQDVNPAVFTDVRNFAFDDISIRMPRDQIYDYDIYDEEEDDELDENF